MKSTFEKMGGTYTLGADGILSLIHIFSCRSGVWYL